MPNPVASLTTALGVMLACAGMAQATSEYTYKKNEYVIVRDDQVRPVCGQLCGKAVEFSASTLRDWRPILIGENRETGKRVVEVRLARELGKDILVGRFIERSQSMEIKTVFEDDGFKT